MAKKHAETMWDLMEPMQESTQHEQYHLLMGQILLASGENQEALTHLQQSDAESIYAKYLMSNAHSKMNDDSKAAVLLAELEEYNFNDIEYALVRNEVTH